MNNLLAIVRSIVGLTLPLVLIGCAVVGITDTSLPDAESGKAKIVVASSPFLSAPRVTARLHALNLSNQPGEGMTELFTSSQAFVEPGLYHAKIEWFIVGTADKRFTEVTLVARRGFSHVIRPVVSNGYVDFVVENITPETTR